MKRKATPGRDAARWWALGALTLTSFLVLLEDTAVSVALPSIRRELGLGLSGLEWVVNAYTLSLAVFMLPAGKLADVHGRRRVFLAGVAIFTLASLLSGLAGSAWLLLSARALQGLGAAFIVPASLSIVSAAFPEHERGTALGIWAGGSSIGLGLGPLVGALLTDALDWSWIFLINVPLGVVALVTGSLVIPESRDASAPRRIPLSPLLLSSGALFALVFALTEAPGLGWTSARVLGLFAAAGIGFGIFVRLELRASVPLLDPSLFRSRNFAGANVVSLLSTAVMCNLFFFLALYFQLVLGYTALGAGATLLPLTAFIVVVAPIAGRLSDRQGRRKPVVAGMALLGIALLLLSRLDVDSGIGTTLVFLGLGGVGIGLTTTPTTAAALDSLPAERAAVGAGVVNVFRVVGLSLGIATMGAVLSAGSADVLAGGGRAGEAFVSGLSTSLTINAGIAFVAALLAARTLKTGPAGTGAPASAARQAPPAERRPAYEARR
jgi:EmrB/QacA subfamily drug resistance transporter